MTRTWIRRSFLLSALTLALGALTLRALPAAADDANEVNPTWNALTVKAVSTLKSPDTMGDVLARLDPDVLVMVIGHMRRADGDLWYEVATLSGESLGWLPAEALVIVDSGD